MYGHRPAHQMRCIGCGSRGVVEELYDVALLLRVRRPMALGLKTGEIGRMITVDGPEPL
jgi:hypothetical protein